LLLGTSVAQAPKAGPFRNEWTEQKNVVRQYCVMDFNGFRLDSSAWSKMQPLTTWKDEPDWNSLEVVSLFQVLSASAHKERVAVEVEYNVLGRFEIGIGYTREPRTETATFYLRSSPAGWKIDLTDPLVPHISAARTLKWLRDGLASENDPNWRALMERAIRDLSAP
jgi:hypothetical protein